MTNVEAVEWLRFQVELMRRAVDSLEIPTDDEMEEEIEVYELAIKALEEQTEVNVYDKEETYHNCTVQVLTNTVTGQTSVGWWQE